MTRRKWLKIAAGAAGAALLVASCGDDEDDEQATRMEPSPRAADIVETTKEPRQFTLAFLEHPYFYNPPKPSILGREVVNGWNSGSILGAPEGSTLEFIEIPRDTR